MDTTASRIQNTNDGPHNLLLVTPWPLSNPSRDRYIAVKGSMMRLHRQWVRETS